MPPLRSARPPGKLCSRVFDNSPTLECVRSDGDDTSKPLTRCFGQLPDLVVPDDFDVDYDDLASEFNGDIASAERRAARDRYARRTEEA